MYSNTLIFGLVANAMMVHGAVVNLYSGPGCSGDVQEANIWDNTCATWMNGFQSFRITTQGGDGQILTSYSQNACYGNTMGEDIYACPWASDVGTCYDSHADDFSGSNAMGSSTYCGYSIE